MVSNNLLKRIIVSLIIFTSYFTLSLFSFESVKYFITIIYILIVVEILSNFKSKRYTIILYLSISYLSLYLIDFDTKNLIKFNLFISIIILFDSFSYIIGKIFGKTKIAFSFSPNKTLEGLIGGIFFSFIISIFYCIIFNINISLYLIIFIFLIIFSSFIGDMIESYFKRINNLKNASNYLPGHGGFFDRFDSLIFSILSYSIFNNLI